MDYITVGEAANKWGVSGRSITYQLKAGRIPGAVKKGKLWLIPADAQRPKDKRRTDQNRQELEIDLQTDISNVFCATAKPMPMHNPDKILDMLGEDRLRLVYHAELSYLRGDFQKAIECFQMTEGDAAVRLRICPITIVAAISRGDYPAYWKIDAYLDQYRKADADSIIRAVTEFTLASTAVSVLAPNMVPDWLKAGDFSNFLPVMRPQLLYLRAKYFYCIGQFDTALAIAQTALTLRVFEQGITLTDIYLRLTCANSCYALERKEEAKDWILSAMRIALPHSLITPFAELIATLGGLVEQCLKQEFPGLYIPVMELCENTMKNWISFHNQFTKENITNMLSLREYHIALLVARRVPYADIAKQYGISVGRLKNIMVEIREKLLLSSREELEKLIL